MRSEASRSNDGSMTRPRRGLALNAPCACATLAGEAKETAMFGIPGQAPVTLTDAAVARIRKLMAEADGDAAGLRIGVKKGGCAGMEYTMEFATEAQEHDEVVEQDGARVMIAPMAQMFLFGTRIDYRTALLESGFTFDNPNVVDSCGCGESVKFADAS
jgi:iron-sulfur cluster assembly protein